MDNLDQDLKDWLQETVAIVGTTIVSVYQVGSFGTEHFVVGSDVDLVYIVSEPLSVEKKRAIKILRKLWEERITIDPNFITSEELVLNDQALDQFLITCCLSWQGKLLFGKALTFPEIGEDHTLTFHAIRVFKSLLKARENPSEREVASILRAVKVLNGQVSWKSAMSKARIPLEEITSLREAKELCRTGLATWNVSTDLKSKIHSLL